MESIAEGEKFYYDLMISAYVGASESAEASGEYWEIQKRDGHSYLNYVIPEPAHYAAIFGALALALLIYRKKHA